MPGCLGFGGSGLRRDMAARGADCGLRAGQGCQDERERIAKRANEGRVAAKAIGRRFGRKPKVDEHQRLTGRAPDGVSSVHRPLGADQFSSGYGSNLPRPETRSAREVLTRDRRQWRCASSLPRLRMLNELGS
jgi:hypothetical protein